ncbi:MAG TPA: glycosyltransferase [Casimicrobiaceae bacterium]|nr:glycosyltransferase [Casimicrobiaceae bacterium]
MDAIAVSPLVTVIVRSMDRPELAHAIGSIGRQDYPRIETIVVDATGGRHRPLPRQHLRAGHTIRIIDAGRPLPRAHAAALGLASARGEWFTYLDDDDTCEPSHISALIAAARAFPSALVIYGKGRTLHADGSIERVFGRPFNRALMHFAPLFYWQAALVRTRVRDLGCAFDPEFEVCEDRDFLAQVAEHGDFVFVPSLATLNFRPDLGTSGTGSGANRDQARIARFDNLVRAKWAGQGVYHNEKVAVLCRQGVHAFLEGDLDGSQRAFVMALVLYPDDPNALHGLARIALARGDRTLAERHARAAIEINPMAAEYRETLAAIVGTGGSQTDTVSASFGRTARCPCGSGRRYKECCGRIFTRLAETSFAAAHATLCASARSALDRGDVPSAWEQLKVAAESRCTADVGYMLEACGARLAASRSMASLWSMARRLRARASAASAVPPTRRVVIVSGRHGDIGARQAALLGGVLSKAAEVEVMPEIAPRMIEQRADECLVFIDPEAIPEQGVGPLVARIVIRMPRNDPAALVRGFARLTDGPSVGARCDFTLPHAGIVDPEPQDLPIEYPWIDPSHFRMPPPDAGTERPLVVGRHGTSGPGEDHPDDPALYRRLIEAGHAISVPATELLRRTLAAMPADRFLSAIDLRSDGAALGEIDVFLYRGDPNYRGHADLRLLEAMAAARVPIVFPTSIGAREWIADGQNGFVVVSEQDALSQVAKLSQDRQLLRYTGLAARETAIATLRAQRRRALAFYLGVNLNE